jgi:hypothetical protein
MSAYLILTIAVLLFVVIFQIAKASEYVSVLKGEEKAFRQNNRINGFLMIGFLILDHTRHHWCCIFSDANSPLLVCIQIPDFYKKKSILLSAQ